MRMVARTILWPARRFFDPRFNGIHQALIADMNAANEAATFTGRSLDTILAHVEEVGAQVDELNRWLSFDEEAPHSLADIDENTARVLNYAASYEGFAAQANLWFNPPLLVTYRPKDVVLTWVNERIAEVPYAFRALCRLPPNAAVLDVGATESSVCLSLATLGYKVTAIDPRSNPLTHERLRVVVERIEEWEAEEEFDAVLCLSTIEHIGTSAYEQKASGHRLDLEAMSRIRDLTRAGGLLVLTTAVGRASTDAFSRVYDREGLDELMAGWDVTDLTVVQRRDATTWVTVDEPVDGVDKQVETVAMITATKIAD
jgi:Methyltransferase domain